MRPVQNDVTIFIAAFQNFEYLDKTFATREREDGRRNEHGIARGVRGDIPMALQESPLGSSGEPENPFDVTATFRISRPFAGEAASP